jgi:O-succinylbenzoic acid--CoA ligase
VVGEVRQLLKPTPDLSRLIKQRRALGAATALRFGEQSVSYAELAALVEQRTALLSEAGLVAGELVLCPTEPVLDWALMQWALAQLGAAMLPMRPELPETRIAALIQATGAEWRWRSATLEQTQRRLPSGVTERQNAVMPPPLPANAQATTTTPALLLETSGSSAEPKIVMLSAAAILASCQAVNARLDLQRGDRWLCLLPRQHVGGLAIGYRCALAGAELVVQSRFEAREALALLQDHAITYVSLVPAMLARLLGIQSTPPPSLRVVLLGGQGLDPSLARRAVAQGWPLYLGYGMSETFSQVAGGWIGADGLPQSGLIPLDDVAFDCRSCEQIQSQHHSQSQPLRIGAPMLMLGYANPTRSPGDGLTDGWLQTSDLGCRLPNGGLQILGRADDVVLIAGINVLPAEIEREIARLEQITEIAVIGVPDPTWGHRLVALYVGELEPAQLDAWCRDNLPSHQRPRTIARLASLPTLSAGKPDRRALIALAESAGAQAERARMSDSGSAWL